MFKCQFIILLALFVAVFGNQDVDRIDCNRLTPIAFTTKEGSGQWYGVEIYTNIGIGRKYVEGDTMCLAANTTALNSTTYGVQFYSINGQPDFDSDRFVFAESHPSGRIKYLGDIGEENIIVAERNKKYVAVAFCSSEPGHEGSSLTMLVTYRLAGQADLTHRNMNAMHEAIKANLGIDRLDVGPLHCRTHGKN